jgi:protein-disulfide isomerase/uncharacterized membrane protein
MERKETPKMQNTPMASRMRLRGTLVLILALVGLGLSVYLSILHVALLNGIVGGSALCGTGKGLGCHAVTASRYAEFFGLPVSVWGVMFFATIALLGLGGAIFRGPRSRPYLLWAFFLVCTGLVFDLYLGIVMFALIQVLCPLCATTYAVNVILFLVLMGVLKRPRESPEPIGSVFPRLRVPAGDGEASYYQNTVRGFLFGTNLLIVAGVLTLYGLFASQHAADGKAQLERIQQVFARSQPRTVTSQGYPEIGPAAAAMTVIEFSDFRCPFCRRTADIVKIVAANNRDRARFVFRHFPLDTSCNPRIQRNLHAGACELAYGSVCAHEQGKFWEFHDQAFLADGRIDRAALERIGEEIGLDIGLFRTCLASPHPRNVVQRDIQEASALGVTSTPTFFFNGLPLAGAPLNPWVFEQLLLPSNERSQGTAAGSP